MKTTQWFPKNVFPVREGWYECKCCGDRFWWNGKHWAYGPIYTINLSRFEWRGLTEEAK